MAVSSLGTGPDRGLLYLATGDRTESHDGQDAAGVRAPTARRQVDRHVRTAGGRLRDLPGRAGVQVLGQDDELGRH